jgi:hypothetical protein
MSGGICGEVKCVSGTPSLYQNPRYQFERIHRKTLYLDVFMGAGTTFAISLSEPLIIDKLSDVFLDTFSTVHASQNNTTQTMAMVLSINEFNITSNIASNLASGTMNGSNTDNKKQKSILIPNENTATAAATNITHHTTKCPDYVGIINPTTLHKITGTITDCGTQANPPVYATTFGASGRFIAEFIIVARDE